jgi:O-antigen/teichoic acid export membrane protein
VNWLVSVFKIPPDMQDETIFVIQTGVVIFSIASIFRVFTDLLVGLQRMDMTNRISIVLSFPSALGTFLFLSQGCGIKGLMINNLFTCVINVILTIIVAYRLQPGLRIRMNYITKEMIVKLFNYGMNMQTTKIAALVSLRMDKLLLGYFLGPGFVALYHIGARIVEMARSFPEMMLSAIMPAASEMHAKDMKENIYALFWRSSKYLVCVTVPLMTFIALNAALIIGTWMGKGFEDSSIILKILTVGFFLNIVFGVVSPIVQGVDKPQIQRRMAVFMAVLNIVLSISMIRFFGFRGAAIGTTVAMSLASFYYIKVFHDYMKMPIKKYFLGIYAKPMNAVIISTILLVVIQKYWGLLTNISDRVAGIIAIVLNMGIFAVIYWTVLLLSKYFDLYDLKIVERYFPYLVGNKAIRVVLANDK